MNRQSAGSRKTLGEEILEIFRPILSSDNQSANLQTTPYRPRLSCPGLQKNRPSSFRHQHAHSPSASPQLPLKCESCPVHNDPRVYNAGTARRVCCLLEDKRSR